MDYSAKSDDQLLQAFTAGDNSAFNALFDRHWQSLFVLAKRILADEHLAQDVIQEVFVSLYERAKDRDISHAKSYLSQAVKYQCFMQLRSGRISAEHLRRLQTVYISNDVEEYMNAAELERILSERIQALPLRCREVFCLSRYELLSNKKIADQLNISQKTVEHQLTKALKSLRLTVDKTVFFIFFQLF